MKMFRKDEGFTLVELMVVVLIIGILVAIAVPVFLNASASARTNSCQANQRTITGAVQTYAASTGVPLASAADILDGADATEINQLVPNYIQTAPTCPTADTFYVVSANGADITGDAGTVAAPTFVAGHNLTP